MSQPTTYSHLIEDLFEQQLSEWQQARDNYEALANVKVKTFNIGAATIKVQFNPARIVSTAAKVDTKTISARKCFLCKQNRPSVQQGISVDNKYTILINPFPIFPKHLTIPAETHTDQQIEGRIADMLDLACKLPDYTLFYNGPRCGASAPDHFHFQAGNKGFMTIESDIDKWERKQVVTEGTASIYQVDAPHLSLYLIKGSDCKSIVKLFERVISALPTDNTSGEPMLNLLCNYNAATSEYALIVIPRLKHRPSCYFNEDETRLLISPASVDMGGVLITPLAEDFERITDTDITNLFDEVCYNANQLAEITSKILCHE